MERTPLPEPNITYSIIVVCMTVRFRAVLMMTNRHFSRLLSGSMHHLRHEKWGLCSPPGKSGGTQNRFWRYEMDSVKDLS